MAFFYPDFHIFHVPWTPLIQDINEFKKFKIKYGDLVWDDYEMCFPIIDLYEDNILKDLEFSSAA